MPSPFFDT